MVKRHDWGKHFLGHVIRAREKGSSGNLPVYSFIMNLAKSASSELLAGFLALLIWKL